MRKGDWIQVSRGSIFYPLDPRPEEVNIEDIAHALAMRCRYAGHCLKFYSVAEHSVHVSNNVSSENALWGLLHDAAEAYSSDIPRPLKRSLKEWAPIEQNIQSAICEKFGLSLIEPEEVKLVDTQMLLKEKEALLAPCEKEWDTSYVVPSDFDVEIKGLLPEEAKQFFLRRFQEVI